MTAMKRMTMIATGIAVLGLASQAAADPTPECNAGAGLDSTECGADSTASADGATAIGDPATAAGARSIAIGNAATAGSELSIAIGGDALANNARAVAVGPQSVASGLQATAVGPFASATGMGASALGNGASAANAGGVALGVRANAANAGSVAVGALATSTADLGTALGRGATAAFAGSTALGANSAATAANQVTLGGAGTHVRIGDIIASTAAQDAETIGLATVDANGVLGRDTSFLPLLSSQGAAILALENDTAALFDLAEINRRDIRRANEGVAMALAMESPSVPEGARIAVSAGVGHYRDRSAGTAAVSVRMGRMSSFSAGVGYGFNSGRIGARAGVQAAW